MDDADPDLRPDPDRVILRLAAQPARRLAGSAMIAALAAILLWIAAAHPPASFGWRLFLAAAGAGALWLALRLWQATAPALELTGRELREAGGRRLALVADIRGVSRGAFALKPSNGFTLLLAEPGPAVWAPGLWWRIGRRVGVGGVTGRHDTRMMAEAISLAVARAGG